MANKYSNLEYKSNKNGFGTKINQTMLDNLISGKISNEQMNTISSIQTANQLFGEKSNLPDISDFMTKVAYTESHLGELFNPESYGAFQFDLGNEKYNDLVKKALSGEETTLNRANVANELLKNMGYGDEEGNFDILSLGLGRDEEGYINKFDDAIKDPLINSLLARMSLATIPDKEGNIGDLNRREQAEYWKKHWNTYAKNAKGSVGHFLGQRNALGQLLLGLSGRQSSGEWELK
jgi:hypothetical protein